MRTPLGGASAAPLIYFCRASRKTVILFGFMRPPPLISHDQLFNRRPRPWRTVPNKTLFFKVFQDRNPRKFVARSMGSGPNRRALPHVEFLIDAAGCVVIESIDTPCIVNGNLLSHQAGQIWVW